MRKIIIFIVLMFSLISLGQQSKVFYLMLENDNQVVENENTFDFTIYIKSKDTKFFHDVYTFNVLKIGEYSNLLDELSLPINLKDIKYLKVIDFFKNNDSCSTHENLSLNKIILIKEIWSVNNLKKEFKFWLAIYSGTQKDIIKTNFRK